MAEILNFSETAHSTHDALDRLQKHLANDLGAVEQKISAHMESATQMLPDIGQHLIGAGGKRLRPMLTLSAAVLSGYCGTHHITLATAVEYMHTATLLHDDVVDDSDMRRGKPTAHRLWRNPASVLVGDFLLGQAFRMMVSTGSLKALDILARAASVIAEGEVMQLAAIQNAHMTEDNYLQIIEAKTATLFSAATEVGGVIAAADDREIEALKAYGRNLGIAFQLVDDALDYGSVGQVLGKNTGEDFREGKVTLPVILAFHRGDEADRTFWQRVVTQPTTDDLTMETDFAAALTLMQKTDALRDTLVRATHYGEKAKDALGLFEASKIRALLTQLVDFCIARAY